MLRGGNPAVELEPISVTGAAIRLLPAFCLSAKMIRGIGHCVVLELKKVAKLVLVKLSNALLDVLS